MDFQIPCFPCAVATLSIVKVDETYSWCRDFTVGDKNLLQSVMKLA